MKKLAWIIDNDLVGGEDKGVMGPRNMDDALVAELKESKKNGIRFQMWSDDNEHYYTGRIVVEGHAQDDTNLSEEFYAPLDHFGRPNAGCTMIKYKDAKGEWSVL